LEEMKRDVAPSPDVACHFLYYKIATEDDFALYISDMHMYC
jgi:hypothetical protein